MVPGSTSLFFCQGFTSLHANQGIAFTLLAPWNCGTSASPNPWTINVNHPVQRPETNMQHATICDNDYVLYVHVCTWTWTHHDASKDFPLIQYATILSSGMSLFSHFQLRMAFPVMAENGLPLVFASFLLTTKSSS